MSRVKLDLAKFKHVSSDKNSTKLKHEDGHFLVLAHKKLSKDSQDQLAALADQSKLPKKAQKAPGSIEFANGGKVKPEASWQQSAEELPSDVMSAINPANLQENAGLMYNAMESAFQGNPGVNSQGVYKGEPQYVDAPPAAMAHGGEAKVKAPDTAKHDNKEYARKVSEGARSGGPTLSQGIDNAKKEFKSIFGYADGGDVENIRAKDPAFSQQMTSLPGEEFGPEGYDNATAPALDAEEPIPDQYARRGRQFANIPNERDQSPSPPPEQQSAPVQQQAPEVPKERVEAQKIYNTIVNGSDPTQPGNYNTRPWATFGPNGEPPKSFDASAWQTAEKQVQKMQVDASNASQQKVQVIEQDNQVRQRAGLAPMPVPGASQVAPQPSLDPNQSPSQPQAQSMEQQPQTPQPGGMPDPSAMLGDAYKNQLAGIQGQSSAQQDLAKQQADILKQAEDQKIEIQNQYKQSMDTLEAERQNHIHDIQAGYINPNQYWTGDKNGNGSHSKIATAIGIILAGFNPTNSPNAAIKFLEHQMEMNINAQKENLGAKQNLLSANLRQYGNLKDALDMTRLMQADLMQNELSQAAAKAQSPMAKAAAMSAMGEIQAKYAPLMQKMAANQTVARLTATANQDPAKIPAMLSALDSVDPVKAKELRERFVPGVGLATTNEGAKGVREMQATTTTAKDAINRLKKLVGKTGKSLSPNLRVEADSLRNILVGALRVPITGPGAMSEGEREIMLNTIPGVANFMSLDSNSMKRLSILETQLNNSYNNMLSANGLTPPPQSSSDIVVGKDGKQYRRQGNFMVPVK